MSRWSPARHPDLHKVAFGWANTTTFGMIVAVSLSVGLIPTLQPAFLPSLSPPRRLPVHLRLEIHSTVIVVFVLTSVHHLLPHFPAGIALLTTA